MTDTPKPEALAIRALKLVAKTDWKSLVLLLTALTGAGGFVWNKVELYVQEYRQTQEAATQDATAGATYEALATRIDELFLKVQALEHVAKVQTDYTPVTLEVPPSPSVAAGVKPDAEKHLAVKPEADAEPEPMMEMAEVEEEPPPKVMGIRPDRLPNMPKPESVSRRFKQARLPEYKQVQMAAEADLEEFMREVKAQ